MADEKVVRRDVVLVGGGHAHVEVLRRAAMKRPAEVRLTVIARELDTPYSGMLPGLVAVHYRFEEAHIDLRPLSRAAGATACSSGSAADLPAAAACRRGWDGDRHESLAIVFSYPAQIRAIRVNSGRDVDLATWSLSGFHPHVLDPSILAPTMPAATSPS